MTSTNKHKQERQKQRDKEYKSKAINANQYKANLYITIETKPDDKQSETI